MAEKCIVITYIGCKHFQGRIVVFECGVSSDASHEYFFFLVCRSVHVFIMPVHSVNITNARELFQH